MAKLTRCLGWIFVLAVAGHMVVRRLGTRSGASDEEVNTALPGDEIIPHPMIETTHSITIEATPAQVWPWLMQGGYRGAGRAGWYADSIVDKIFEGLLLRGLVPSGNLPERPGATSPRTLLPGVEPLTVGDILPDGPPGSAWFEVRIVEPERVYALYSDSHLRWVSPNFLRGTRWESDGEFTWAFVLRELPSGATRLILRTRANYGPPMVRAVADPVLYLAEAIWPSLILSGIRSRAEALAGTAD